MKAIIHIVCGVILVMLVPFFLIFGYLRICSMPKFYKTDVVVQMIPADPGASLSDMVASYAEQVKSDTVLDGVVLSLNLNMKAGQIFNGVDGSMSALYARKLLGQNTEVTVLSGGDGRIKIAVRSQNADDGARVANEIFVSFREHCESADAAAFGKAVPVLVDPAEPAKMLCMSGFVANMSVACLFSIITGIIGMVLFVKGVKLRIMQTRMC